MKKPKAKARKHSEIWYGVHNSVRFVVIDGLGFWEEHKGILISKTKKGLKLYKNQYQRVVKIKIQEL